LRSRAGAHQQMWQRWAWRGRVVRIGCSLSTTPRAAMEVFVRTSNFDRALANGMHLEHGMQKWTTMQSCNATRLAHAARLRGACS
jgi:hypothetical protein